MNPADLGKLVATKSAMSSPCSQYVSKGAISCRYRRQGQQVLLPGVTIGRGRAKKGFEDPGMSDREQQLATWLRAANAGDQKAYRLFLAALAPVVRRYVAGRASGLGVECEDIVQETLLAVHLKRQTWDETRRIGPWISTIARNKLIDAMRRRGYRINVPIEDVVDTLAAPEPPEAAVAYDVERLLGRLSESQRTVVRAITMDGLDTKQVAQRLGRSEGAIRVLLHRGLAALAAAYKADPK